MPEFPHYVFDVFRLEIEPTLVLYRGSRRLSLKAKELAILRVLLAARGRTLSNSEIADAIGTGNGNKSNKATIARYVSNIRSTLGDRPRKRPPRYIQNFSGQGYRFIYTPVRAFGEQSVHVGVFRINGDEADPKNIGHAMTEFMSANLSAIGRINVIRDDPASGPSALTTLHLSGKITISEGRVLVSVLLHRKSETQPLWHRFYMHESSDLLGALEAIATMAADNVAGYLEGDLEESAQPGSQTRLHSDNPEALALYEDGVSFLNQRTAHALLEGRQCFEQAVKKDPLFLEALAGLADCNLVLGIFGSEVFPPTKVLAAAKKAATKALKIDDTLVEARTTLAAVKFLFDRDIQGANEIYESLLEERTTYPPFYQFYAHSLALQGRFDEALQHIKYAQSLRASPIINATISRIYYLSGQYQEAIASAEDAIRRHEQFFLAHVHLGIAYQQVGEYAEAIKQFQTALALYGSSEWGNAAIVSALGHAFAKAKQNEKARAALRELETRAKQDYISPFNFAMIYLGLNNLEDTFKYLEKTYEHRAAWLMTFKVEPIFGPIRDDPRFQDLLRRIGF